MEANVDSGSGAEDWYDPAVMDNISTSLISEENGESTFDMSLLPEEILERILSFLSPYKDMDTVKLVCKQWNRVMKSVVKHTRRIFHQQLMSCNVRWTQILQDVAERDHPYSAIRSLSISERFSHSAAYLDGSVYVFGGCSSTNTTFNDLWRLDLTTRMWMRPVAMGSYPSPKACATMVVYNGKLILFGGWSHPIPYPLHQSAHYFSELHQYDPASNRWSLLLTVGPEPEPIGGHSASVVGNLMVVFGGSTRPGHGSNKVWVYNFPKSSWSTPRMLSGTQPEPRYGQFQCTLDDHNILIMGGCVGNNKVFNDFYILTMHQSDPWFWTKLDIKHPELGAQQTWCHAACKVNDSIVVVAKSPRPREARNVPADVMRLPPTRRGAGIGNGMANRTRPVLQPQQPRHQQQQQQQHFIRPQPQHQDSENPHPQRSQETNSSHEGVTYGQEQAANGDLAGQPSSSSSSSSSSSNNNRSLLALQQRLHRDCINVSDGSNHRHNPSTSSDDVADSHIDRLQNRAQLHGEGSGSGAGGGGGGGGQRNPLMEQQHHHSHSSQQMPPCNQNPLPHNHHQHQQQHEHQQPQQQHQPPHHQQLPSGIVNQQQQPQPQQPPPHGPPSPAHHPPTMRPNRTPYRHVIPMPSVRPNATCNRQRQLEALQRQEEILRSKSRALAAARVPPQNHHRDAANNRTVGGGASAAAAAAGYFADDQREEAEDVVPATVMTKNLMDVHVCDIGGALGRLCVEWRPPSSLQPPGAPSEAICCSLVEGRGELVLFGGVSRQVSGQMLTNVAVSKLHFLHP